MLTGAGADKVLTTNASGIATWQEAASGGIASDLNCTDCIGPTEITDSYVLNTSDAMSGSLTVASSVGIGTTGPATKLEVYGGHGDTKARLYSTGNGGTLDASLDMWASEPGVTYDGSGIGNNVNGHPYYGRRNTGLGQSYIRFQGGNIYFATGAANATNKMTIDTAGAIHMNSQKITNLATPTVATDAATKGYVDSKTGYLSCRILNSASDITCNADETTYLSSSGTGCLYNCNAQVDLGAFGTFKYTVTNCSAGCSNWNTNRYEILSLYSGGAWTTVGKIKCGGAYCGGNMASTVAVCCK